MNNLSDSATKKHDELKEKYGENPFIEIPRSDKKHWSNGFKAGYEVGRDEMNQQVQLLEDALKFYANCKSWGPSGHQTNHFIAIRDDHSKLHPDPNEYNRYGGKIARLALESLAKVRGGT